MIYYTTVRVQALIGNEHKAIDEAIKQAGQKLEQEAGVPVLLTNVIPTPLPHCLCVTVLARPLEGQERAGIFEALDKLGWRPETTEGTAVKPFPVANPGFDDVMAPYRFILENEQEK